MLRRTPSLKRCIMKIRNYLVIGALILGVLVAFFRPESIDTVLINDVNTIVFIILLFIIYIPQILNMEEASKEERQLLIICFLYEIKKV